MGTGALVGWVALVGSVVFVSSAGLVGSACGDAVPTHLHREDFTWTLKFETVPNEFGKQHCTGFAILCFCLCRLYMLQCD